MRRWWVLSLFVLAVLNLHAQGLHAGQESRGDETRAEMNDSRPVPVEAVVGLPPVELNAELSPALAAEALLKANAAYEEGEYTKAVAGYQRLLRAGFTDGRVYYNLGNAQLRGGELGRAIASYLRSRALRPRDEDVRANLDFARQSTKDAIEPPEPSEVLATLFFWHFRLSHRELAVGLLAINVIFWSVLGLGLLWPSRELIRWTSALLLVIVLTLAASLLVHRLADRPVAVIVPQEVAAHTAPEESSVVRFKLHAGTELSVQDQRQGWVRVSLPDGQQGWVSEEWVELAYR